MALDGGATSYPRWVQVFGLGWTDMGGGLEQQHQQLPLPPCDVAVLWSLALGPVPWNKCSAAPHPDNWQSSKASLCTYPHDNAYKTHHSWDSSATSVSVVVVSPCCCLRRLPAGVPGVPA